MQGGLAITALFMLPQTHTPPGPIVALKGMTHRPVQHS